MYFGRGQSWLVGRGAVEPAQSKLRAMIQSQVGIHPFTPPLLASRRVRLLGRSCRVCLDESPTLRCPPVRIAAICGHTRDRARLSNQPRGLFTGIHGGEGGGEGGPPRTPEGLLTAQERPTPAASTPACAQWAPWMASTSSLLRVWGTARQASAKCKVAFTLPVALPS